jgi:hypothetical protein
MTNSLGDVLKEALARKWAEDDAAHKQMEEKTESESKPKGRKLFQVTNNLSRATFEHIKYNPAKRTVITHELEDKGYNYKSVASVITQMIRQKLVTVDKDGVLHAIVPAYVPLKSSGAFKKMQKLEAQTKRPVSLSSAAGLAAIAPVPTPAPAQTQPVVPTVITNEVEHILNTLPIKQAHALYVELDKIFGAST